MSAVEKTVAEMVLGLEAAMEQNPARIDLDQFTSHHFCAGPYARELFIPRATVAIGKRHA